MEEDEEMSDVGMAPAEQPQDSIQVEDLPASQEEVDPSVPDDVSNLLPETLGLQDDVLHDSQLPASSPVAVSPPAEEQASVEAAVTVELDAPAAAAPVEEASVHAVVASADMGDMAAGPMDATASVDTAIAEDRIAAPIDGKGLEDATGQGDTTPAAIPLDAAAPVDTTGTVDGASPADGMTLPDGASPADRMALPDGASPAATTTPVDGDGASPAATITPVDAASPAATTTPVDGASPAYGMASLDRASPAETTASMVGASPPDVGLVDGAVPVAVVDAAVLADALTPADATVSPTPVASVALAVSVDMTVQAPAVYGASGGAEVKEAEEAAVAESGRGGRRKRGRPIASLRHRPRAPPKKKEEEDVCFICFDGGNLVLCDRRCAQLAILENSTLDF